MKKSMNSDTHTVTPIYFQQELPTKIWASNHYDILDIFQISTDNKIQGKFSIVSSNSRFQFSQLTRFRNRDRKYSIRTEQSLQMLLKLSNGLIWTKSNEQYMKIHYSHGRPFSLFNQKEKPWRIYGSCSVTRSLTNPSFKIGLLRTSSDQLNFLDLRYRLNIGQFVNEHYVYGKGGLTYGRWNVGWLMVKDIKRKRLQKNDIKIGCQFGTNNWLSAQIQVQEFRDYRLNYHRLGSYFDILRLAYIHNFSDLKWIVGLQYQRNLVNNETKLIEAVINWQTQASGIKHIKAKINNNLQLSLAGVCNINSRYKFSTGATFKKSFAPSSWGFTFSFGQI